MTENMKQFLELAVKDRALYEKAEALGDSVDGLIALAAEQGVTLCEADFTTAAPTALDDDALDDVAGGKFAPHQSYFRNLLFTYLPGGQPPAATPLPVRPGQTPAAQTMEIRLGVPGPGKPVSL